QGFITVEYLAASILDMDFHTITKPFDECPMKFEKDKMKSLGLISEIDPRYRCTYFGHIFSGGYSSGYYSYIWAEIISTDAFELFKQKGIFDKKTAESFRRNVLEKGYTEEPMVLYKRFRGAEPDITPLLKNRGLDKGK
ncbi:MAG: M3 family metallopeptidase, partial [Bacteroidales bacterium]|nr:M3 family metallopeptidase [Bacteroidales bacterium]